MKKVVFFSLLVALVLVSCSKDDKPASGQEQASFDVVFSGIKVLANYQNVTPPNQKKQLTDVLSSINKDKASYVKEAEIQYSNSYILLEGLKPGESLAGLTINLTDGQTSTGAFSLGKINADPNGDPIKYSTNNCMTFLSTVTNELATKKSVTLQVVLSGSDMDIDDLKITVHTMAIFHW